MPGKMTFLAFSGGLDSTTLLCMRLAEGAEVQPVFFDYGSKHNAFERKAANDVLAVVCPHTPLKVVELHNSGIFEGSASALLADSPDAVPDASYTAPGSLAATVVPGRNLIMASILASMAEVHARRTCTPTEVALGVHAGDHVLYPDCRPDFVKALQQVVAESSGNMVSVAAPFLHCKKKNIVRIGRMVHAPLHLTRSCYKQQALSCGKCGTCRERLEAFAACGLVDPIPYGSEA